MKQIPEQQLKLGICPRCCKPSDTTIITADPWYQCHACGIEWCFGKIIDMATGKAPDDLEIIRQFF